MNIVTFNIRVAFDTDGINSFIYRAGLIYETIMKKSPDVILFQEMTDKHLDLMEKMLPEYSFHGHLRGKDYGGEGLYTAVRKENIQVLGFEVFWISPTPSIPGSRFENQSECPRICVISKLREKWSGKVFRTFNVHLDHISEEARVLGIKCVLEKVCEAEKDDLPYVVGGDFNTKPNTETLAECVKAGLCDVTDGIEVSFHDYGKRAVKIDYIYADEKMKKVFRESGIWDDEKDGIYLSDHYPVYAEFDTKCL